MSWFSKLLPGRIQIMSPQKKGVPEGLWTKCEACQAVLYRAELERNVSVCPKCKHHHRIAARKRLETFLDPEGMEELATDIEARDPLKFKDLKRYRDRILAAKKETDELEALLVMQGMLYDMPVVAAAFEFRFMGGSMGSAVGARFVRGAQRALELKIPYICFCASGGARMQEGLISLMQMAKTSAILTKLASNHIPYISVLTDPTMGGVSASLAMLGDIIIAEPNALIGFAGPRVIEQTVRHTLPEGFQRSEFLLKHGAIDMILDRRELRDRIASLLSKLSRRVSSTRGK